MGPSLLTREEFRAGVFARDGGLCVLCGEPGVDAHHIMDRKLFPDGGYYLDNGATLCGECHLQAEGRPTEIRYLPVIIRYKVGIKEIVIPPGMEPGVGYDKWGEPIKYPQSAILDILASLTGGRDAKSPAKGVSQKKIRKAMRRLRKEASRRGSPAMPGMPGEAKAGIGKPEKKQTRGQLPTMPD